ncbi:MAG TPA: SPFH domain-containing protein [Candidatus Acidoferrales bacterium]
MSLLIPIVPLAVVIGFLILRLLWGPLASSNLLEYQRGVLYRRGLPVKDLGPGRHRVWLGIEKLIIVDVRPIQVSYENQQVALRDGATAVYSFSGTACVTDARKVIYCARNYSQLPEFVFLCCSRRVMNGFSAKQLRGGNDALVAAITKCAEPRLTASGFELLTFRLNQVSVISASFQE